MSPPDGKVRQVYYSDLLPIRLIKILDEAGSQKTKSIRFKQFPTDAASLPGLFIAFLEHKKKQAILHDLKKIPKIEDLQKLGLVSELSMTTAGSRKYGNQIEAVLEDDVYVYAAIEGIGAHFPVDLISDTMDRYVFFDVNKCVSVDGRAFYEKFTHRVSTEGTTLKFGQSVSFSFPKAALSITEGKAVINYTLCGSLRQRVIDLDFLVSLITSDGIEIDGIHMGLPIDEKPNIEELKRELEFWQKAVQTLDMLHISEDIDIKSITDKDNRELRTLVTAFAENKPIFNLRKDLPFYYVVSVGQLRIALIHTEKDAPKNASRISSFFSDSIAYGFMLDESADAHRHFAPPYAILDESAWATLSNIHFDDVVLSFDRFFIRDGDDHIFVAANNTLISVMSAYDESVKEPLLSVAKQLSEWLTQKCPEEALHRHILTINYLQVIKRSRNLEKDERTLLRDIAEDLTAEVRFRVGAYILLDNHEAAEFHFSKMDAELQEVFLKWPICRFWNR